MKPTLTLVLCALALHAGAALADNAPTSSIDRTSFDTSVRAQDDLFHAANGGWLKNTPIPPDKASYGVTTELRDRSDDRVRKIVEELAAQTHPLGSIEHKIGSFYRSYVDEAAIDKAGMAPLAPWLAQVDAVTTHAELARLFGRWQGIVNTPMTMDVDSDSRNPRLNIAQANQGGLGLPDRDYYLKAEARFVKSRQAYLSYLETLFRLLDDPQAAASAKAVFALEKQLAEKHWTRVQNRDPVKTYNPMPVARLLHDAPGFDWRAYLGTAALGDIGTLSVSQPSYAKAMARTIAGTPIGIWRLYLRAHLVDGFARVLPKPVRDARFEFRGKALQGLEQERPRWQQATAALDSALGEAVGQVYVARHFPPAYKARMLEMVGNLLEAYRESIASATWMSPRTKRQAQAKLAKYMPKIGYPDKWRDYSKLEIRDGDAFGNDARAGRFEHERIAAKARKPVDRSQWYMTPQTVNAYYNPSLNEIVFPAAILEPPFFDMAADDAANYGDIGSTIGHEISHGFDDSGSQFDGDGKLRNWWTPADKKAFTALGAKLVAQYGQYEPVPGHKVNGELTLGENIADLSGLQIAYKAYR
ncbi:MAG TPA: M13 family metallopeptidase, partial [Albitalea sp.]|nr:M13 family metallopeptidase [Albitalea sp.]